MQEMECGNCRFWLSGGDSIGQCRRYAPKVMLDPVRKTETYCEVKRVWTRWPLTTSVDWCGEFERNKKGVRP